MEIRVRNKNFGYTEVMMIEGAVGIDLGLLNESEKAALASTLRQAAYELDNLELVTKESALGAIEYYRDNLSMAEFDDAIEMLVEAE